MKNGLVLPTTCTGCPETAVPALSVQGVIDNFNCFTSFLEQMVPNKFPLSTSVFLNVLLIRVRYILMVYALTHLGYLHTGVFRRHLQFVFIKSEKYLIQPLC